MKKTKAKFIPIILLLILLCVVSILYGKNRTVYAETIELSLDDLCGAYTANTDLYEKTDNNENLDNYESYLESRFKLSNFHNEDRTITDEWIMRIVPKTLFEQKKRNFLYLGNAYGFYFDYQNDANVFIYLFKHNINPNISGQVTRKIEPFYYEMYRYDSASGTASLQHFTETVTNPNGQVLDTQYFYRKYSANHDIFLRNVSFSGALYNENHLNFGESGYDPNIDHGAYFFGGTYLFKGVSGQSASSNLYFDTLKFGLGLNSSNLGTAFIPFS